MKNETEQEKNNRIFNHYKNRILSECGKDYKIRFNVIEYLCSFPKIDPVKMAQSLISDYPVDILFDDTSISQKENEKKQRQVYDYINHIDNNNEEKEVNNDELDICD